MASETRALTMPEELVLLLLKDDTGFVAPIPEWRLSCALVSAVLLELSFKERIDADLQFLPETDLEFAFIASLIAGHYVGSAMSFALYELMRNPDLGERIAAEADALFARGDPAAADLDLKAIDVTHRFVMENLRLHPVIPVHNRTAANAFEVGGRVVPARSTVLMAFPAAHFMAENFEAPDRFDIDRYLPPRSEHRKRGAYQPFGVGTHLCLGQHFSELMMVANLLLLAHHLELEMVPTDYRLKLSPLPKFSPDRKFGFRVRRVRNPLPPASGGGNHVH